jgi:hypothetical protein
MHFQVFYLLKLQHFEMLKLQQKQQSSSSVSLLLEVGSSNATPTREFESMTTEYWQATPITLLV